MNALIEEIKKSLLNLVGSTVEVLPALLISLIILILTRFFAGFVKEFVTATSHRVIRSSSLQLLMIQTCYVMTWVVGTIVACVIAFPDLGLGDIIGLLGLSSVAIGFAFQDIFKNFLAGILLLLQEPFQIGDQIIVTDYEGTVEKISIRSTQIRTYQGERIVMPNSILFTSPVRVRTAEGKRRTDLAIGVDYDTPLPLAIKTLIEAVKPVEGVLSHPEPEVDIVGFGESSIDLMVRFWTFPEQAQVRRVTSKVMLALKQDCDRHHINIPYPIRTVYFNDQKSDDHSQPVTNSSKLQDGQ